MRLYGNFKMPNIALFMANNDPYMTIEANFAIAGKNILKTNTPMPAYNAMEEIGTTKMPENNTKSKVRLLSVPPKSLCLIPKKT